MSVAGLSTVREVPAATSGTSASSARRSIQIDSFACCGPSTKLLHRYFAYRIITINSKKGWRGRVECLRRDNRRGGSKARQQHIEDDATVVGACR